MPKIELSDEQIEAVNKMHNGCILKGGVGVGKSRTAIAYYYILNGGQINTSSYVPMKKKPMNLIVITTAKKRDTLDWQNEMTNFLITTHPEVAFYDHEVIVDSWNNIAKYVNYKDSFFIFDEQRACGTGLWAKCLIKIAKKNQWILLSATPGDKYSDYAAVFVANGFYYCISDFKRQHYTYRKLGNKMIPNGYVNVGRLNKLKRQVLVVMKSTKNSERHDEIIYVEHDVQTYKYVNRQKFDIYKNEPIQNASGLCYALRKIVNSDARRIEECSKIVMAKHKVIIFYNFDYELEMLRKMCHDMDDYPYSEWNGHKHQDICDGPEWVYLVNYMGGAEGWECTTTDTMIFFSQTYSYKAYEQAHGRIDRRNTPYPDLYYYTLVSKSPIDMSIKECLRQKKDFNESEFKG